MTSNEISDIIFQDLAARGFPVFLSSFQGLGFEEADVFGIARSGYMNEYEIKVSRADFKADFKKNKHKLFERKDFAGYYDIWKKGKITDQKELHIYTPNRFYYACEPGLILLENIPKYAGLVYITSEGIEEIKMAPIMHRYKADERIYKRIATILSQRVKYGCSYMNYKHKKRTNES